MGNSAERARFWADFICSRCQFPAAARLSAQFSRARFSEFCECGCNSFKVEVASAINVEPIARLGKYGAVFEASFNLSDPDKTLEIILFSGQSGCLEYVEIDCCGNSCPVPEEVHVAEPPFHIYASPALLL